MSLARRTQERIRALKLASAPASGGGHTPTPAAVRAAVDQARAATKPGGTIAATMAMRLTQDLRRLKEIKAVERKVAAKREMLPEYRSWVDGVLEAGRLTDGNELGATGADEVLPICMVWSIDVGDWPRALELGAHVLRFNVPLPSRYNRDAATLLLEEIAMAALKAQAQGQRFPLDVLEKVDELTLGIDMHDEPRAKLLKAIGIEQLELAQSATEDAIRPLADRALASLRSAQALNDRVGVKTQIKGLEKLLAALPTPMTEQAGSPPAE